MHFRSDSELPCLLFPILPVFTLSYKAFVLQKKIWNTFRKPYLKIEIRVFRILNIHVYKRVIVCNEFLWNYFHVLNFLKIEKPFFKWKRGNFKYRKVIDTLKLRYFCLFWTTSAMKSYFLLSPPTESFRLYLLNRLFALN